jgi:hypothetical protein
VCTQRTNCVNEYNLHFIEKELIQFFSLPFTCSFIIVQVYTLKIHLFGHVRCSSKITTVFSEAEYSAILFTTSLRSRHLVRAGEERAENCDVNNLDGAWGDKMAAIKFPCKLRPTDFAPNCINIWYISDIFYRFTLLCFLEKQKLKTKTFIKKFRFAKIKFSNRKSKKSARELRPANSNPAHLYFILYVVTLNINTACLLLKKSLLL